MFCKRIILLCVHLITSSLCTLALSGFLSVAETQDVVDPCKPEAIEAWTKKDSLHPVVFNYRITTAKSECTSRPSCKYGLIELLKCNGKGMNHEWPAQKSGKRCVRRKGCYMIRCGEHLSQKFNLSGTAVLYEGPIFRNTHLTMKFPRLDWAKGWLIRILLKSGTIVGEVEAVNQTDIVVPGNYTVGVTYTVVYQPLMSDNTKGCSYSSRNEREHTYTVPTQPPLHPSSPFSSTWVIVLMGLGCLAVVVAISAFIYCSNTRCLSQASSDKPQGLHMTHREKGGEVLLVQAQDNAKVEGLCSQLAIDIRNNCDKKVRDICFMNDPKMLEAPSSWILEVLAHHEEVTIILVVSPALVTLQEALQRNKDSLGCLASVRGEGRPSDPLLHACLHYLHTYLSRNYQRLLVVRFTDISCNGKEELPELVPGKRFLLPQHQQELLQVLNSSCRYKATYRNV